VSKDEIKSTMSAQEREKRRAAVGKVASEKIAKSEQLNFRIEEKSIKDLQKMAFKKGLPVGTMIRDWVLERLAQEKLGDPEKTGKALLLLDETYTKLKYLFETAAPPSSSDAPTYHDLRTDPPRKSVIRERHD
jgi:predicted DNA binding CopG/RHH family protein